MCGRIGLPQLSWAEFVAWQQGLLRWEDILRSGAQMPLPASWNVKPTQTVQIGFAQGQALHLAPARWWFVPDWFRGATADWKATTFNARIETASTTNTFKTAWHTGRCVLPVSGYYEWTGPKGAKQPWWITAQSNAPAMMLAGLYSNRPDRSRSCTILTRAALPQLSGLHARSPVILSEAQIGPWLHGQMDHSEAQTLGLSWEGRMQFHQVARFGLDADGPGLITPEQGLLL